PGAWLAARPVRIGARIRGAVRRPKVLSAADRWGAYLGGVEPALAAVPRGHRFARPPVIGKAEIEPAPLAVWIDGDPDSEAVARTRGALGLGGGNPAALLQGSLAQALGETRLDRVVLIRAGDEPAPIALERLGQAVIMAPDAVVITCDDDRLD